MLWVQVHKKITPYDLMLLSWWDSDWWDFEILKDYALQMIDYTCVFRVEKYVFW